MYGNRINGKIKIRLLIFAPAFLVGAFLIAVALQAFGGPSTVAAQADTNAPTISSVAITSDPDDDIREDVPYRARGITWDVRPSGIYGIGDDIEVTVTFNEDVTVTGAPKLDLNIGGTLRAAGYLKAEDDTVVFRYTVAEGDSDTNGVAIDADKVKLNGGSIRDSAGNDAVLSHDALAAQTNHRVDGIRPWISLIFSSTETRGRNRFMTGDIILVRINYSNAETAFASVAGPPQLMLDFDGVQKAAEWKSIGNLGEVFWYYVQEGDLDTDGVEIKANSISLNGGFIKDQAGNDAILTHQAVPAGPDFRVDAVLPTVTSMAITSDPGEDDTYDTGNKIEVTVTFSENVDVPRVKKARTSTHGLYLELDIGGVARVAKYKSISGKNVVFDYTVQAGDSDEDGISIGANKLYLDGGVIKDSAGNNPISATLHKLPLDAVVSHGALAADSGHKVAGSSSPVNIGGPTIIRYKENSVSYIDPEGKRVGQYVGSTSVVTWSLSGADGSLFYLKGGIQRSGHPWRALWFNSPPNYEDPIDADADNEYEVTIEVSDGTNSRFREVAVVVTNDVYDSDEVPVITGTPQVGETLTADVSRMSAVETDLGLSYGWYRTDGTTDTSIDGADKSTYTLTADDEGSRIKVRANVGRLARPSEPTAVVTRPGQTNSPASGQPTISGTAEVGETLTAGTSGISDDDGLDSATFSYQWLSDDADISGATNSTYTLVAADGGKAIKVRVSFTDDAGNRETRSSAATAAVVASRPDLTSFLGLFVGNPSGTYVGETFTISAEVQNQGDVAAEATTLRYYQSTDATIGTSDTEVGTDDVAALAASERASMSKVLTAPDTVGTYYYGACVDAVAGESDTTNNCSSGYEIVVLAWNSPATGQPTISGTAQVGQTLTADASEISDDDGMANAAFSHQWLADDADISGATGSSYALAAADVGKAVKVRVSFTDDEGHKETLTSSSTSAVAAAQPEVSGVAVSLQPESGDTYALGETIRIRVTFSEAVAVTGSPRLKIDMDPADWGEKWASYESGSGASDLIFAHQVVEPNFSTQGIAVLENTLELNGGAIKSTTTQAGAALSHTGLGHDPSHKVDWQANRAPVFHGVAEKLDNALPGFLVSLPMFKTDFRDPDGDPLTFTLSASRNDVYGSDGDMPGIVHNERVGRVFFLAKSACALAALDPPTGDAYYTVITMTATDPDGATAHTTATFRTDPAAFVCPSFSSATVDGATLTMVFDADLAPSYTEPTAGEFVVKADGAAVSLADTDAVSVSGDTISLTLAAPVPAGQTVTVSYAPGDFPVVAAFTGQPAANLMAAPAVTEVEVASDPGNDDTYRMNDVISIRVTFSEAVDVNGSPRIKIKMDPNYGEKWAAYQGGSGTATLTFAHTVVEPNISTQGIAVLANTLGLNGGTIQASGVDASLSHTALGHNASHKVDWRLPAASVSGVEITSEPGDDDTYASDDVITITVTFSKTVDVTGAPRLKIDMDPAEWGEKWAAYESGSGTATLTFTHTVVEPNISTQGIAVLENSLELNGGTIQADGLAAQLAHTGLGHDADHKVDWQLSEEGAAGS